LGIIKARVGGGQVGIHLIQLGLSVRHSKIVLTYIDRAYHFRFPGKAYLCIPWERLSPFSNDAEFKWFANQDRSTKIFAFGKYSSSLRRIKYIV
jgi:hypothetical protein